MGIGKYISWMDSMGFWADDFFVYVLSPDMSTGETNFQCQLPGIESGIRN